MTLAAHFAAEDTGRGQGIEGMSAPPGVRFISFDDNAEFSSIEANTAAGQQLIAAEVLPLLTQ